jgi:hypothetical protein
MRDGKYNALQVARKTGRRGNPKSLPNSNQFLKHFVR